MAENKKFSTKNKTTFTNILPEAALLNVPPQAVEVERAVIGAIMLESDAITLVQDYLQADAFYEPANQKIFAAAAEISNAHRPVDAYTVMQTLKDKEELELVGGFEYLVQLTQSIGSAANIEEHARIVAQKYIQRELINSATEIQRRSYDESIDVNDLIGFAEQRILEVTDRHVKNSVQSAADILTRTLEKIEKAGENKSKYSGIESGFSALDNITLGWQPSDLIIIAARPSMGKTAFVLSMARNIAVAYKTPVAFFSLEMSAEQIMTRLIVGETEIAGTKIRSGQISAQEWALIHQKTEPLSMAPLYVDDTPALSIFEFRSKARRLYAHNHIKIIVIDYLQLMTGGGANDKGNREQEVAFISRTLKAIAKELDIPIIALSQLNRATETRGGSKRPVLSDLRESGAIEQDADIVAFIHRPEYYGLTQLEDDTPTSGLAELIIAKHRNGEVTDVRLKFLKDQAKFTNADDLLSTQYEEYESSSNADATPSALVSGVADFEPNRTIRNTDDNAPF